MKGQGHWSLLTGIILVLIVVLVGSLLIQPVAGFDVKKYFGLSPQTGVPGGSDIGSIVQTPPGTTDSVENIITAQGAEIQPSELGCSVADDVYADFSVNGNNINRDDGSNNCITQKYFSDAGSSGIKQCMVGSKVFKLDDSKDDGTDDSSWESTLSARIPSCHVCLDEGLAPHAQIKTFDEICINDNLKTRKVGTSDFCNGYIPIAGTSDFGNCDCGSIGTPSGTWKGHCGTSQNVGNTNWPTTSFCNNNEDRIKWIGTGNSGQYVGTGGSLPSGTDPSTKVRDYLNSYVDGNSISLVKHDNYIYGLIWMSDREKYDLLFERVPTQNTATNFNFISDIANYERLNRLGNWKADARMVEDVIVTLPVSSPVIAPTAIIQAIATATGLSATPTSSKGYVNPIYDCKDSCFIKALQYDSTSSNEICSGGFDDIAVKFREKNINFITDVLSGDGFQPGSSYRVIINNWYGRYQVNKGWGSTDDCFMNWDRSVIITKATSSTITDTFAISPSGHGLMTVQDLTTSGPQQVVSTAPLTLTFHSGDTIKLIATGVNGHTFSHFGNDAYGVSWPTSPATFTVSASGTIFAYFT